jgi:hypothetical protein
MNKEKILLGLVIISIALVMLFSYFKWHADVVILIYLVAQTLLLGNYLFDANSVFYKLLLLGFFIGLMGNLFVLFHWPHGLILFMGGAASQIILGLSILYKGIKETLRDKDFELFVYLLGGLLIITGMILILPLIFQVYFNEKLLIDNGEFLSVPLLGVIITIMFNSNIWNEFVPDQKKILTYVLLITTIPVVGIIFERFLR